MTDSPLMRQGNPPLPKLTEKGMTVLSCLYHTDGQLLLVGGSYFAAFPLIRLGLVERVEGRWHRVTPNGADVFVRLVAEQDTPQGAAARRRLEAGAR